MGIFDRENQEMYGSDGGMDTSAGKYGSEDSATEQAKLDEVLDSEAVKQRMAEAARTIASGGDYKFLVRGAKLRCSCGSHGRCLNLPKSHGVYYNGAPLVFESDCEVGEDANIRTFGVCSSTDHPKKADGLFAGWKERLSGNTVTLQAEPVYDELGNVINEGENIRGLPCVPYIVGEWQLPREYSHLADNSALTMAGGAVPKEDGKAYTYKKVLDTHSFLVCLYGGIITPETDGQEESALERRYEEILDKLAKEGSVNGLSKEEKEFLVDCYERYHSAHAKTMDDFLKPLKWNKDYEDDILNIKVIAYTGQEEYKKLLFERLPHVQLIWHKFDGQQFSLPGIGLSVVALDDKYGINDPRGPYHTFFHELGHQIDYGLIYDSPIDTDLTDLYTRLSLIDPSLVGNLTKRMALKNAINTIIAANSDPQRNEMIETMKNDVYENIRDKIDRHSSSYTQQERDAVFDGILSGKTSNFTESEKTLYDSILSEFREDLIKPDFNGNGASSAMQSEVTDSYGGYTNNTLRLDSYGHPDVYWDTLSALGVEGPYLELFADNFAAHMTGYESHLDALEKYFPNVSQEIDAFIKQQAEGIK